MMQSRLNFTPRATLTRVVQLALLAGSVALASLAMTQDVNAASGLCATGTACRAMPPDNTTDFEHNALRFTTTIHLNHNDGTHEQMRAAELSDQEYFSFSGVGAIVCTVDGQQRMSTAFLVGAFDLGVTVAHTFERNGTWTDAANCVYTTTDSIGQIRERIPVSYIKAQWKSDDGSYGQPAKDFAVVRLAHPSRFAQRTMPLGKFSGAAASVLMIGFKSDIDSDTVKHKSRGTVYERRVDGMVISSLAGFTHDMDSRDIAAGAPVIDELTGVIIGIHTSTRPGANTARTRNSARSNTMITMNEWLESTLRFEMEATRKN